MNFLTYHNHGDLGFADAINRIDLLTRLSNKFGLTFAMPDLATGIHNNNYLVEFGLHQYRFHHNSLSVIQTIEINLDVFVNEFDFKSYDKCLFVIKNFDYGLAGKIARTVTDFPSFPFKQFFKSEVNKSNEEQTSQNDTDSIASSSNKLFSDDRSIKSSNSSEILEDDEYEQLLFLASTFHMDREI